MSRPDTSDRRHLPGLATLLLGTVLLFAACAQNAPTASPSTASSATPPASVAPSVAPSAGSSAAPSAPAPTPSSSAVGALDAVYDTVERQVVAIRGLKPSRPVERQFITSAEAKAMLTKQFDDETPAAYLAGSERLYKALGLIPAGSSLRDLTVNLLGGAVAAFYNDEQGKLYVITDQAVPGPTERFYFAHEFDHALQDQNSTIFKDQHAVYDQGDRLLARQAIYEGDATLLMTQWAAANLSQAELLQILSSSADPEAQAVLDRTPAILRDTLTWPYTTGLGYVQAAQSAGGWPAVNAFFTAMPESTEQILHPEKYASHEAPVQVTMPPDLATKLGSGWTVQMQDTFGEYQLGVWLRESGVKASVATAAAAGWGGDRLAVAKGPNGAWAVVLRTTWDSVSEASDFLDAAQIAVNHLPGPARISAPGGKDVTIMIASDDHALLALDLVFGATGV